MRPFSLPSALASLPLKIKFHFTLLILFIPLAVPRKRKMHPVRGALLLFSFADWRGHFSNIFVKDLLKINDFLNEYTLS
jgi:hypothetical protein